MYLRCLGIATVLLACGDNRTRPLDARADGQAGDARRGSDAALPDASHVIDARSIDASHAIDARSIDASHAIDARSIDASQTIDARSIDASHTIDARSIDAGRAPDASVQTDAGTPGVVSCYTEGNPAQSCTLPTHCCFSNYSSQHDGFCAASACVYGTISCDGPEDCGGGEHCCSHALFDSGGVVSGYSMACQANACGPKPANYELCHIGGQACPSGGTCVTAYLNDNDLPRTLDICR